MCCAKKAQFYLCNLYAILSILFNYFWITRANHEGFLWKNIYNNVGDSCGNMFCKCHCHEKRKVLFT
jgi:hypothetical protein